MVELIEKFKNREIKAKEIFKIQEISKKTAYNFVKKYHYLGDAKFFSMYNYGLFLNNTLVGTATYSLPQGIQASKGWCGFDNNDLRIQELHRLCLIPELNNTNAASFLLGNSLKKLKKKGVKIVISLADSSKHVGSIYQVCNFKYYGLTAKKSDFYSENGTKNQRGQTKNKKGVWIQRTRKHRYAYLLDKNIKVNYKEEPYPKKGSTELIKCCNNGVVHDDRFDMYYTCPICNPPLRKIINNEIQEKEILDEW